MIVLQLSGGLGNQMFQYAYARALALRQGVEVALYWSEREGGGRELELPLLFPIRARLVTRSELKAFLGWQQGRVIPRLLGRLGCRRLLTRCVEEPEFRFDPELCRLRDGVLVRGYFQSERYFREYGDTVRAEFRFVRPLAGESAALAERIARPGETAVSVHVRRGDYASVPAVRKKHGCCPPEYYRRALEYVAGRVENPRFYLFSDDIGWVRRNLAIPFPHHFSEQAGERSGGEELRLMALCRHHVIANSTFSWWGAWLDPGRDRIVVAPRRWFADGTPAADLLPADWITL